MAVAALGAGIAVGGARAQKPAPASGAAVVACSAGQLVAWLDTVPNGAAGSLYYGLEMTNISTRACTLRGYPRVSGVAPSGRTLGRPAVRGSGPIRTVTLLPRRSATSTVRIVEVGNYPRARCGPALAAGLRVAPPGETPSSLVPYPFEACRRYGPHYLAAGPFFPARNSPGGSELSPTAP